MSRIGYAMAVGSVGPPLMVAHAIRGDEGISRLYRFDVEVSTFLPGVLFERLVLGRSGILAMRVAETVRVVHGLVASVRGVFEADSAHGLHHYSLRLVPSAWKLRKRHDSRIFQNKSVEQILREVAEAMGVVIRFDLERQLPTREYTTQFDETDYAFFCRLCAENGLLFYFEQPPTALAAALFAALDGPTAAAALAAATLDILREASLGRQPGGGETLVVTDRAAYVPIAPADAQDVIEGALEGLLYEVTGAGQGRPAGPTVPLRRAGGMVGTGESLHDFSVRDRVSSTKGIYREFDPGRPLKPLEAEESIVPEAREGDPIGAFLAAGANPAAVVETLDALLEDRDLQVYFHEGRDHFTNWEAGAKEPERILAQARRKKKLARGRGNVARFEAGHTFKLEEHPLEILNSGWVITRVRHRGSSSFGDGAGSVTYENEFECVPVEVPFVPPRPGRRVLQTCMTATVVGPDGEEIHVDDQGRIKVKFHWDRAEELAEPTCWIRVMHGWAGTAWGTQLIPRVGMEAIVAFENGDPDKPLVLGCVYNRVLPTPFKLPEDKSKSGIRTRSTPRSDGFNELSFQDRAQQERIYVHAQRDLDADVERNRTATIGEDDTTTVRRDQRVHVGVDQHVDIVGDRRVDVRSDDHLRVHGSRGVSVRGGLSEHAGSRSAHIDGDDSVDVHGSFSVSAMKEASIDGRTAILSGDRSARVDSFQRATVYGGDRAVVQSSSEVFLNAGGAAFIRITDDTIQISAPKLRLNGKDAQLVLKDGKAMCKVTSKFQVVSDDAIVLRSAGASLGLKVEAKLDGAQILLNSPEQASDTIEVEVPQQVKVVARDQDGEAISGTLVVVTSEDGSETAAMSGEDGSVSVDAEGQTTVTFPDLSDTE